MPQLSGIQVNDVCSISTHWKLACEKWLEIIEQLCKNFDYIDAPWEYLERTNSAMFASALTACGFPSMPEAYVMRNGTKKQKDQRVDICSIHEGQAIELIEFKMAEYNAATASTERNVRTKINQAIVQVNNVSGLHGRVIEEQKLKVNRTAAVLGLPYFLPGTPAEIMNSNIDRIIDDVSMSPFDIKAWIFPEEYTHTPSLRYNKQFYIGTFVLATSALQRARERPHAA